MNDKDILDGILAREGSTYTNDPTDLGGPTKFGITLKTLEAWRHVPCTAQDVQLLTEDEARAIYHHLYFELPGYVNVTNDAIRAALVDAAVNCGPYSATSWLQKALGVPQDGVLGPLTLQTLAVADQSRVLARLYANRIRHYGRLITDHPAQARFAAGWLNRVAELMEG